MNDVVKYSPLEQESPCAISTDTPITMGKLKIVLAKHAAWLNGEDGGKRADLSGANLRDTELSGVNLRNANLRDTDLWGANLRDVNLSGADLWGANLRDANLWGANLRGANLRNANLRNANLRDTDLRCACLRDANLWCANLRGADLWGVDLSDANLSGANLSRTDLRDVYLWDTDLRRVNLRDANLILAGQDIRGYLFYASVNAANVVVIHAGCREFVGVSAARAHWSQRHTEDEVLHADCLSLVDRIERMATVRGWILEPETDLDGIKEADK